MKLYLLTQEETTAYDTFDSCVVCAESEEDAKSIDPINGDAFVEKPTTYPYWVTKKENIECTEIGTANENQPRGVVCASYNAG